MVKRPGIGEEHEGGGRRGNKGEMEVDVEGGDGYVVNNSEDAGGRVDGVIHASQEVEEVDEKRNDRTYWVRWCLLPTFSV